LVATIFLAREGHSRLEKGAGGEGENFEADALKSAQGFGRTTRVS